MRATRSWISGFRTSARPRTVWLESCRVHGAGYRGDLRLLQREAEASLTKSVNSIRRDFDRRLAEGEVEDLENEIEAALLKALEDALADVSARLGAAEKGVQEALARFGVTLVIEGAELEMEGASGAEPRGSAGGDGRRLAGADRAYGSRQR